MGTSDKQKEIFRNRFQSIINSNDCKNTISTVKNWSGDILWTDFASKRASEPNNLGFIVKFMSPECLRLYNILLYDLRNHYL